MKLGKRVAALSAMSLVAASASIALGAVSPAQAATGGPYTLNGSPQNQAGTSAYGGTPTIELTAAASGTDVVITADISVGPTTTSFAGFNAGAYRLDAYVTIDGGPMVQLTGTNPALNPAVPTSTASFPSGTTTTATVPGLAAGPHTIELNSLVIDSNGSSSGSAFSTSFATVTGFDAVYNFGTTTAGIIGGAGTTGAAPTSPIGLTEEVTVLPCDPDAAVSTLTTLTATPPNSATVGTSVTLSSTVTAENCDGDPVDPIGKIQFKNGSTDVGAAQDFSGTAVTFSTSSLAVGGYNFTAVFTPTDEDAFNPSTSAPVAYSIKAKETPKPTPTETEEPPVVSGAPRSASATVTAFCDVVSQIPGAKAEYQFPMKITVTPGAAAPGSTVNVSVAIDKSPINTGPSTIDPGEYRMEATVGFQGKSVQLIGPSNKSEAPPKTGQIFKANELPLVAKGSVTLPKKEGEFPITVKDIWLNNQNNEPTGTVGSLKDTFDQRCNASSNPVASPKAFAKPVVDVESNEDAAATDIEPSDDSSDAGGDGTESGGVLAATGPRETLILGLLALAALQVGAIMAVRAHRSTPKRRY